VIHSAARLTYTEVADILGNTKGPEAARRQIVPHLLNLYDVPGAAESTRPARRDRFRNHRNLHRLQPERQDRKIIPRTRNDAHRLIEECMLTANVCAADLLIRHKHPGTYRIHASRPLKSSSRCAPSSSRSA
jgi:ribonuclease R